MAEMSGPESASVPDFSQHTALSASDVWQSGETEQRTEALSTYLSQAAAMTPIQIATARARELARLAPGSHVIDIGCGTGVSLLDLAAAVAPGGVVTAVDHAPDLLAIAEQVVEGADIEASFVFQVADAESLPYPNDSFDAAYISRVLIHLNDPDRALREAYRVVRPGGWVAAIEPDFDGMRVDHDDPEAARFLVAGHSATIRNPAMGIELFRRLDDAGFVERTVSWLTELESVYDPEATPYYRRMADEAVAFGWLTRARANAAVDYLIEAGANGRYVSYSTLMIAAGRVPGAE
jgi:ubiquinone/menaquinone biosynthesis C-methylase UbiE